MIALINRDNGLLQSISQLLEILGNGRRDGKTYKPELYEELNNKHVIEMSCGGYHSLVLTIDGEVYGWGSNDRGQIGNRYTNYLKAPYFINELNGEKVKSISCCSNHSLVLTQRGKVYSLGQLSRNSGIDSNASKLIELKEINIERISCGLDQSLLLSHEGEIYVRSNRELRINTERDTQLLPIMLNNCLKFTEIACHWTKRFSSALSTNGFYYIWGNVSEEHVIEEPQETKLISFNEIFINYFEITYNVLDVKIIEFNDNFIRNGFYEKKFNQINELGEGSYGKVFEVKEKSVYNDKKNYAIKRISFKLSNNLNDITMLSKELEHFSIIKQLNYEKLVKYYDIWFENYIQQNAKIQFIFIQMELCDKTLNDIIHEIESDRKVINNNSLFHYYNASQLFIQILEGVNYLHTRSPQIIHRDLKPDNILIKINNNEWNKSVIKIADMGLICLHNNQNDNNASYRQYHTQDVGAISYAAPEVLNSRDYDTRADIYSLGVVLKQLFLINDYKDFKELKELFLLYKYQELKELGYKITQMEVNQKPENSYSGIRADIYSLGVVLQQLFLINDNRDSTDESVLLLNKYKQLRELFDKMTEEDINERPESCEQILEDKRFWSMNKNECTVIKEFSYKLNQYLGENNIKLSFVPKKDFNNKIIIVTKEDKVYEFERNSMNNLSLIFGKINESLLIELCNKGID